MHLDIAAELQSLPEATVRLQQRACDRWRQEFNHVRPHDALRGQTPADVYRPSPSRPTIRPPRYPPGWLVKRVNKTGTFGNNLEGNFISTAVAGHFVGLQPLAGLRYRAWFYDVDLGDLELAPTTRLLSSLAS
jgi:hypothetical protein